jgi:hypothetical protein
MPINDRLELGDDGWWCGLGEFPKVVGGVGATGPHGLHKPQCGPCGADSVEKVENTANAKFSQKLARF